MSIVKKKQSFGILLNKVTDGSVENQMVFFIQYVNIFTKKAGVSFDLLLMFWKTPFLQTVKHCTKLF